MLNLNSLLLQKESNKLIIFLGDKYKVKKQIEILSVFKNIKNVFFGYVNMWPYKDKTHQFNGMLAIKWVN